MTKAAAKDERYDVETHFGFGRNWAEYAKNVREAEIGAAREGVLRLLDAQDITGKSVLDIGCGSGLHSLAMLNLGAAHVTAIDIDLNSVATAQAVLDRFAGQRNYDVRVHNILAEPLQGQFDIVYSWGVLHHTGDMAGAISAAQALVKPGGMFVIALYKKTPLCGFWKREKKFYTSAPKAIRIVLDMIYAGLYCAALAVSGTNPVRYVRSYKADRGMHFMTDVRDWLGGYPYESIAPEDVDVQMRTAGFALEKSLNTQAMKAGGLFGSGCAEYVFRRS